MADQPTANPPTDNAPSEPTVRLLNASLDCLQGLFPDYPGSPDFVVAFLQLPMGEILNGFAVQPETARPAVGFQSMFNQGRREELAAICKDAVTYMVRKHNPPGGKFKLHQDLPLLLTQRIDKAHWAWLEPLLRETA